MDLTLKRNPGLIEMLIFLQRQLPKAPKDCLPHGTLQTAIVRIIRDSFLSFAEDPSHVGRRSDSPV